MILSLGEGHEGGRASAPSRSAQDAAEQRSASGGGKLALGKQLLRGALHGVAFAAPPRETLAVNRQEDVGIGAGTDQAANR